MEFKDLMKARRSVNHFDPHRPVDDGTLREIVETAALSPSGFNLQPWSLMVFRSIEDRRRLRKLAWDQAKLEDAPVVLALLADMDAWKPGHSTADRAWQDQIDLGYVTPEMRQWFNDAAEKLFGSREGSLVFAVRNACFFGMALMLAAKDAGLESHPISGFDHDALVKEFDIPDHMVVPMLLVIGHFDEGQELKPPKWRKSWEEIVVRES